VLQATLQLLRKGENHNMRSKQDAAKRRKPTYHVQRTRSFELSTGLDSKNITSAGRTTTAGLYSRPTILTKKWIYYMK